jgi:hypothetical protein
MTDNQQPQQPQQPPITFAPHVPKEAVFEGWTSNPDDPEQWGNSLMIQTSESDTADEVIGLVRVETNYKPHGRVGNTYPVDLTLSDAVLAAAAILSRVHDTLGYTIDKPLAPLAAADLLGDLLRVDEELGALREQLLADLAADLRQSSVTEQEG